MRLVKQEIIYATHMILPTAVTTSSSQIAKLRRFTIGLPVNSSHCRFMTSHGQFTIASSSHPTVNDTGGYDVNQGLGGGHIVITAVQ